MSRRTVLDYDHVFTLSDPGSDRVFVFSDSFRAALLQLVDRLYWSSAWTRPLSDQEWAYIEEGVRALLEDEAVNIPVNVTVTTNPTQTQTQSASGGSGGCSSPPPWAGLPGQCYPLDPIGGDDGGDYGLNPPGLPPPGQEPGEWDAYRCKLANYAWYLIDQWLSRLSSTSTWAGTVALVLLALWGALPAGLLAILGATLLELAAVMVRVSAYAEMVDDVLDYASEWWRDNQQMLVCRMYNATDAAVLRDGVLADFASDLAVWAESRPWWFDGLFSMMDDVSRKLMPILMFTAPFRVVPPVGYVPPISCACDGGGDDIPAPDASPPYRYVVVPLRPEWVDTLETESATGVVNDNVLTMTPTGPSQTTHRVRYPVLPLQVEQWVMGNLAIEGETWDGIVASVVRTTSTHGHLSDAIIISGYSGGNSGWFVADVSDGRLLCYHSSEDAPPPEGEGTEEFKAWVDNTFPANSHIRNTPQRLQDGVKATLRLESFGTPDNAATLAIRQWLVVSLKAEV